MSTLYEKYDLEGRAAVITGGPGLSGNEFYRSLADVSTSMHVVLGRVVNHDEMNGALLFLSSDSSSYRMGINLAVDRGWTIW